MSSDPPPRGAPDDLPPEGPTELVEDDRGELVERLSTGTATLLLAWLIGTGAGSALLAVGLLARVVFGRPLGLDALFSGPGLYLALLGASGPCVLWLAGRAQGHTFGWFVLTAAKMALLMVGIIVVFGAVATLILTGGTGADSLPLVAWLVGAALMLSVVWALVVWVADRTIARARLRS